MSASAATVLSRLTERWSYPPWRAKRLVAVSDGVAAEPRRYLPPMAPVVSVNPTGVDTGAFRPDREARRVICPRRVLFIDGRNGLPIGRSAADIAERLSQPASDPALRASMGWQAKAAVERYD